MATLYQRRTAARRATSGIDRLAKEFERRMQELSGQEAARFGEYTQQVADTMRPYEQQMEEYRTTLLPEYERQVKSYKDALTKFEAEVEDVRQNPFTTELVRVPYTKAVGGTIRAVNPTVEIEQEVERPMPQFTAQAPVLPAQPAAPEIAAFDTGETAQQRKQLQSDLQRELGERRGAKLAAVQRRPRGGLMQGA
jgi:hypothetical protein